MERIELSTETEGAFRLTDAVLLAIVWEPGGHDLRIDLTDGLGRPVRLTCFWATGVNIALRWEPKRMGLTQSWECEFNARDQRWLMTFSFPPEGTIELECDGAVLDPRAA